MGVTCAILRLDGVFDTKCWGRLQITCITITLNSQYIHIHMHTHAHARTHTHTHTHTRTQGWLGRSEYALGQSSGVATSLGRAQVVRWWQDLVAWASDSALMVGVGFISAVVMVHSGILHNCALLHRMALLASCTADVFVQVACLQGACVQCVCLYAA